MNTLQGYYNHQASPYQSHCASCQPQGQMAFMMQKMQMALQMIMTEFQAMQLAPQSLPNMGQRPNFGSPLGGFLGSRAGNGPVPTNSPGPSNSTGPSGGGGYSSAAPPASGSVDTNIGQPNQNVASRLMSSISRNPVPPGCGPGYCYRGVKYHLRQVGVNLTGRSAYQAAGQLASSGRFREVRVERSQLRSLPAGAVVVWNRGNGRRHGHISIAMGNGREASGGVRPQIVNYPNSFRVFIPR